VPSLEVEVDAEVDVEVVSSMEVQLTSEGLSAEEALRVGEANNFNTPPAVARSFENDTFGRLSDRNAGGKGVPSADLRGRGAFGLGHDVHSETPTEQVESSPWELTDRVLWVKSDEDIPEGSVGTVVLPCLEGRHTVQFDNGARFDLPKEELYAAKEAAAAIAAAVAASKKKEEQAAELEAMRNNLERLKKELERVQGEMLGAKGTYKKALRKEASKMDEEISRLVTAYKLRVKSGSAQPSFKVSKKDLLAVYEKLDEDKVGYVPRRELKPALERLSQESADPEVDRFVVLMKQIDSNLVEKVDYERQLAEWNKQNGVK